MVRAETSWHVRFHHQPVCSGRDPGNINTHVQKQRKKKGWYCIQTNLATQSSSCLRTLNQHNRAHCAAETRMSACLICCNRVSVKMLGASKLFWNEYQPLDFSFQLISIISNMTVQIETSLGGTSATQLVIIMAMIHEMVQVQELQDLLRWRCSRRSLTFCKTRHWEWNADDPNQVLYWYQRPKNSSDAYCFTFASVD